MQRYLADVAMGSIQHKIDSTSRRIDYYFQACAMRGAKKLHRKHGSLEKMHLISRCSTCLKYLSSRDHTNYETACAEFTEACVGYVQRILVNLRSRGVCQKGNTMTELRP